MNMKDWAAQEVEIAKHRQEDKEDRDLPMEGYNGLCLDSALKAYTSLTEDGHSGMSFSITKMLIIRLMEGLPLSTIQEDDECWIEVSMGPESGKTYQCSRMYSLFKKVSADGSITYNDVDRVVTRDITLPGRSYSGSLGFISDLIDSLLPITMPYYPTKGQIVVTVRKYLSDPKNGDYDTVAIHSINDSDGRYITLEHGRFFKETENGGFVSISQDEFYQRKSSDSRSVSQS